MERLIVSITGASGAIYGIRTLEILHQNKQVETHLVISPSAGRTIAAETSYTVGDVKALADVVHPYKDIGASISSGSYRTLGMLIAPCSIKTLSGIANCYDNNLIVRAADVCFKERRRVVLMVRETPLHRGHVELILKVTNTGGIVMPPVPAFYHRPTTIAQIVDQTVGRALDLFGIDSGVVKRWTEAAETKELTAAANGEEEEEEDNS